MRKQRLLARGVTRDQEGGSTTCWFRVCLFVWVLHPSNYEGAYRPYRHKTNMPSLISRWKMVRRIYILRSDWLVGCWSFTSQQHLMSYQDWD